MTYIETPADHAMTAFLGAMTPGKALRDRSAMFSKPERKRAVYLRQKSAHELAQERHEEIQLALQMARAMKTNAAYVAGSRTT